MTNTQIHGSWVNKWKRLDTLFAAFHIREVYSIGHWAPWEGAWCVGMQILVANRKKSDYYILMNKEHYWEKKGWAESTIRCSNKKVTIFLENTEAVPMGFAAEQPICNNNNIKKIVFIFQRSAGPQEGLKPEFHWVTRNHKPLMQ